MKKLIRVRITHVFLTMDGEQLFKFRNLLDQGEFHIHSLIFEILGEEYRKNIIHHILQNQLPPNRKSNFLKIKFNSV